jgi:hypothetical protein
MSDNGDSPLTPDEEALVAGRLAEAAGPLPMPADVEDRLRSVVAELVSERRAAGSDEADEATEPGGVVQLRERRRWPRVLLAAAAVLVVGYAAGTVAGDGSLGGSGGAADSASGSAGAGIDHESLGRSHERRRGQALQDAPSHTDGLATMDLAARPLVRLRSDRLDHDVRRALEVLSARNGVGDDALEQHPLPGRESCLAPEPSAPHDRSLEVRYDGAPAVLVAHGLGGGLVDVTVYDCTGLRLDGTVVRRGS